MIMSASGTRIRTAALLTAAVAALAVPAAALAGPASANPASAAASAALSALTAGQTLLAGGTLVSQNQAYRFVLQTDGNLVEYGPAGWMWSSNTVGSGRANRLVMQTNGNLVMYSASGQLPFATGEVNSGSNDSLVVQNDGNVVQYGSGGAVFSTNSDTERAIQWFYNRVGATSYEGKCELAVENSFGTEGQYATAYTDWQNRAQHPNSAAAPRGTLVFYKTSAAGHATVSLGNGTVISTSAAGREIGISPVTGFFTPLLGWAPSPW